jgi:hypothetical protein
MFKSPLHEAVLAHVKTKIKEAEQAYQAKLQKRQAEYEDAIESAEMILETQKQLALEESIQFVIKSLQ